MAPTPSGDIDRNGAIDNATGTAELIEVARAFKAGRRPARTVVFAAWTAEEKGLLGAEYYAAHPIYPLARTAAVINLDPHVVLPAARNLELIGPGQTSLEDDLRAAAAQAGQRVDPEPSPEAGWYFRSDHYPFAQRGVPALAFRAGRDLVGRGRAAGQRTVAAYNRDCYHQPCDEFDPRWTFAGTAQEALAAYRVGLNIANSTSWPTWRPGSDYLCGPRRLRRRAPRHEVEQGPDRAEDEQHPPCRPRALERRPRAHPDRGDDHQPQQGASRAPSRASDAMLIE